MPQNTRKRSQFMHIYGKVTSLITNEAVAGIPVSDGRTTVLTDSEGRYEIDTWEKAKLVYLCALTRDHDDWYIHLTEGREEYNFLTRPETNGENFSFFHNSDIEIESRADCDFNDFMRREVKAHKPAFFVNGGDLCREEGLRRHYLIMNRETVGCPVRYCIGNHDFRGDDYGESVYEKYYGPTFYSFDCGGVHFVVLSLLSGDKKPLYTAEDQSIWLKNDLELLAKDKRVFVFCHNWVSSLEWKTGEAPKNSIINLRDYNFAGCAVGHHHVNVLHEDGGVLYMCTSRPDSGGIDSSLGSIRKVSFTEEAVTSDMIYLTRPLPCDCKPVWEAELSGTCEHCAPLSEDGRIYIATNHDGYPKACGIYCLDFNTGATLWYCPAKNGIKGSLVLTEEQVIAETTNGELLFLCKEDGSLLRSHSLFSSPTLFSSSTPLIKGGMLFAGHQTPVFALEPESCRRLWEFRLPRVSSTPSLYAYDESRRQLIAGVNWSGTYAINIDTGETVWEQKGCRAAQYRTSSPLIHNGYLYLGGLYCIAKLSLEDGSIVKQTGTGGIRMDSSGAPTADGDTLYFPTGSKGVIAVDCETLEIKHIFPAEINSAFSTPYICGAELQTVEGSPIIDGDRLIFADNGGSLRIYNKTSGELLHSISLGEPTLAPLAFKNGCIIAAGLFGKVKKLKIEG